MEGAGDAYRVLQVDPSAEDIVIQAAYRVLARRFHPDGDRPDPHRMAEINRAYATIRDPDARRRYDMKRAMLHSQPIPVTPTGGRVDGWTPRRTATEPSTPLPARSLSAGCESGAACDEWWPALGRRAGPDHARSRPDHGEGWPPSTA